jgi:hypothetical protein
MAGPSFRVGHAYASTEAGIVIPVHLVQSDHSVRVEARLDTGAAHCLFDRLQAELLGIDVEAGIRQRFRTVTGSFIAFGHEVTLRTYDLEWSSIVYFHESSTFHGNFLARAGWLDRIRLGLVHYDQQIFIESYDDG